MNDAVEITSVRVDNYDTKTFFFEWDRQCQPGQFLMVWIPGIDEVPMSLSSVGEEKSITVKKIGEATEKIHELRQGDTMYIRGPYGNGFSVDISKRLLIVAGGVGAAAVMPLIEMTGADVVIGARTSDDLLFESEASRFSSVSISTDDGSKGFRGNAVQLAQMMLQSGDYDIVAGCGPEIMLYHLHKACENDGTECQLSLERYMKCAAGVCGSCMLDEFRVCADGPVFTGEQMNKMKEFGKHKRDASGILVRL